MADRDLKRNVAVSHYSGHKIIRNEMSFLVHRMSKVGYQLASLISDGSKNYIQALSGCEEFVLNVVFVWY